MNFVLAGALFLAILGRTSTKTTKPCYTLNSLQYADIYHPYSLLYDDDESAMNVEYDLNYLKDAIDTINALPHEKVSNIVRNTKYMRFLTGQFDGDVTLKELVNDALEATKGTILENLVRFRVANKLQFIAVLFVKAVVNEGIYKDNFVGSAKAGIEGYNNGINQHYHRLKKGIRTLGKAIKVGDVRYDAIEDVIDLFKTVHFEHRNFKNILEEQEWIDEQILGVLEKYAHKP
ncbi:hypothetical protein Y032_0152g2869 [Ancylostoma ceylanicum]|uniref:SXP/RAL-2 family protein Ani s 5-like cation-binding domain-containing protein n=1 Tax=Ancylostoma ceylanicum TaxID=53326 RepID=A0A016SZR7_9BILA|nr:hypothetical protein Y032_0152g2869 [Ancylostoma ceylanicum]